MHTTPRTPRSSQLHTSQQSTGVMHHMTGCTCCSNLSQQGASSVSHMDRGHPPSALGLSLA
eukprot:9867805-Prorocentrum_lima.AAC.1